MLAAVMLVPCVCAVAACSSINKDPDTITWYVGDEAFNYEFSKDSLVGKTIYDKFGLNIQFVVPNATTGTTPLSTKILQGDMYDILTLPKESSLFDDAIDADLLYTYDELFEMYGIEDFIPENMRKWYAREDGMYGILSHFSDEADTDSPIYANQILIARKDLMDEYGIKAEDFSTMSGFKSALSKAKRSTNISNFIPFFSADGGQALAQWLAIPKEDEEGNYLDWRRTNEGEKLFADLWEMNQQGLITTESYSGGLSEQQAILQGNVFCMVANWAEMQTYLEYSYENGREWVLVGPLRNDAGDDPVMTPWTRNGYLATSVSKKSDKAEQITNMLKFLYSDEGQILLTYGEEGTTYTLTDDGKIAYTAEYLTMDSEDIMKQYGTGWMGVLLERTSFRYSLMAEPATAATRSIYAMLEEYANYTYDSRALESTSPSSGKLATNNQQAATYFDQQFPQIVRDKSLNKDGVIAKIKEVFSYIDDQYNYGPIEKQGSVLAYINETFKENKQKMGVKYVWPSNL